MPAKNPWQHEVVQLNNKGLDLIHPIEQVDAEHYSRMEDVKSLQEGTITPRPGTSLVNALAFSTGTPVITAVDVKNHGDGSPSTGYTSGGGNVFFDVNKLYLCAVFGISNPNGSAGPITATTVTGGPGTWVKVVEIQFKTISSTNACIGIFRKLVTSGAASANISYNYSTTADTGLMQCWEFSNVNTTGTNGSGAIVQTGTFASDSASTGLVTLNTFSSGINAAYGAFSDAEQSGTMVPGSGFANGSMPSATVLAEWKNAQDTTVDCTRSEGAVDLGGVAIEIKAI